MTIHITPRGISTVLALSTTASTPVNVPTFSTLFASPIVFGTGNGTQAAFTIGVPSGVAFPSLANLQVARTDWQGRQLLYPTPRTNLYGDSTNLTTALWYANGTTVSGPSAGPDGTSAAFTLTEDITTGAHDLAPHGTNIFTLAAGQACYFRLFVSPGSADRNVGILVNTYNGTNNYGAGLSINPSTGTTGTYGSYGLPPTFDEIVTYASSGGYVFSFRVTPAAGYQINASYIHMLAGNSDSYTGNGTSHVVIFGPMASITPGAYIPNGSATPAPVTDYTLSGTTVNLAQAPASGATLDWNGNVPLIAAPAYLLSNPGSVPAFVTISQNGALAVIPAQGSPSSAIMVPAGGNIVVSAGAQSLFSGIVASGSVNLVVQPCETTIIP